MNIPSRQSPPRWLLAAAALTLFILLGVTADKMLHESYGLGGWLVQGFLLVAAVTAPLLSTYALMSGRGLPSFLEVLGPTKGLTPFFMANMLGVMLIVTTLIATQTALSLIFDARWRDFPFAALTMAVVPFWTLAFLNRPKSGTRPLAEAVFTALFALAAVYIILNEGMENWQAMWTGAVYFLLCSALWRARTAAMTEVTSTAATAVLHEVEAGSREGDGIRRAIGR